MARVFTQEEREEVKRALWNWYAEMGGKRVNTWKMKLGRRGI
nr:exclusion protein [Escherichia coli]